ncbi:MAG TPA: serine/threonine dehydratase [Pseudonocardiaceae bacterium]|jgi:threonine dehydratase|nr:serine/threonine dehydratase [Pseudonocardiaceae bacterium]
MTTSVLPTESDVADAARRIAPHIRTTPMLDIEADGRRAVLKLEHLQLTGSFKIRGALNALLSGPAPELVVTASGGNHGLAVATAARLLGLPAVVYVPLGVPEGKARRIEARGARLIRHGERYSDAAAAAQAAAIEPGTRYLPAYDEAAVIAGQGTVAAEVAAARPDVDAFVVAVGGGGLAAGTVVGGGRPVIAVEPDHCCCLHDAVQEGAPVDVVIDSIAASALGATRIGALPFELLRHQATELVTDEQILAARDRLWEEYRLAVEPAAAAPYAAWLDGRVTAESPCLIVCGANTDWVPA